MRHYIIKFIPKDDSEQRIIHKVKAPERWEKGSYKISLSFESFSEGKRKDATKEEAESYHDRCCWSPKGLYSTIDFIESEWLRANTRRIASLKKFLSRKEVNKHDETKWPFIIHENLYAFYEYIGFDRKKRIYVK